MYCLITGNLSDCDMYCQIKKCIGCIFLCHRRCPYFNFGGTEMQRSGYEGLISGQARQNLVIQGF